MIRLLAIACGILAGVSVAQAGRVVHESLTGVVARAAHIVVADVVAVDEFDDTRTSRTTDLELRPQQLLAGETLELAGQETLLCRYREDRVQRRGDAVVSPLVSGSGEEFGLPRGASVIVLLAALPEPAADAAVAAADEHDENNSGNDDAVADTAPTCTLLRIEPLQNRIAILRVLRKIAEARGQR